MRQLSLVDQIISKIDKTLFKSGTNSFSNTISQRIGKTQSFDNNQSSVHQLSVNQLSVRLMRVNHTGEVCAQALYQGQALVARNKDLESKLRKAAEEEQEHLLWCSSRILELGGKTSLLNPIFAVGSFGIGVIAGLAGDKVSLGFIAETEHQVMRHLDKHLQELPDDDSKSREILIKMREDECRHATQALQNGGITLPPTIQKLMKFTAKIMTFSTRYI